MRNDAMESRERRLTSRCNRNWEAFKEAMGAPMKPAFQGGLPSAPWGWRTSAPDELGERLKEGLERELAEFEAKAVAPSAYDDYDGRRAFRDLDWEVSGVCVWALDQACRAGAFEQALRAVEAADQIASRCEREPLIRALIEGAVETRREETPSDAARRLIALAASEGLWSAESAWAKENQRARDAFIDGFGRDKARAAGWTAAKLIKAAELRPECAVAVAKILSGVVKTEELNWGEVGEEASGSLSRSYIRAEKAPAALFELLPPEFWLGAKVEMLGASKLGARILSEAFKAGKADRWVKDQACLLVWSGLDRKEIDAFEAAFPGESADCLGRAMRSRQSPGGAGARGGHALSTTLSFRFEAAAKRPSGKWARAALSAHGLDEGRTSLKMGDALRALIAQREADILRKQIKEDKAARAKAAEEAGEAPAKRVKKAAAKSL